MQPSQVLFSIPLVIQDLLRYLDATLAHTSSQLLPYCAGSTYQKFSRELLWLSRPVRSTEKFWFLILPTLDIWLTIPHFTSSCSLPFSAFPAVQVTHCYWLCLDWNSRSRKTPWDFEWGSDCTPHIDNTLMSERAIVSLCSHRSSFFSFRFLLQFYTLAIGLDPRGLLLATDLNTPIWPVEFSV
jgi:hypothetical protein